MSDCLYPTLDNLLLFLSSCDELDLEDAEERKRAAVARYIGELPGKHIFATRKDWRAAVEEM